jgi:hypothetical protein
MSPVPPVALTEPSTGLARNLAPERLVPTPGGGSSANAGVCLEETRDGEFFKEHEFLQLDLVQSRYQEVRHDYY